MIAALVIVRSQLFQPKFKRLGGRSRSGSQLGKPASSLSNPQRPALPSNMDPDSPVAITQPRPPIWRWMLAFLLVGCAWGLTTPFMRRAAVNRTENPLPLRSVLADPHTSWIKKKTWSVFYDVADLLRNPDYAIPLLLNITGSVWFFLLIGQAGESINSAIATQGEELI